MGKTLFFAVVGYLSGSVLYAKLFCRLFGKADAINKSRDHNPGTSNAFKFGGFWCGLLTLVFDLLKGFVPTSLYVAATRNLMDWGLAFVLAAPVIGHIFPLFYKFKGGKGIAASFGCLLGILPYWLPLMSLASVFIFFSVALRISPNFYRTAVTYPSALILMIFFGVSPAVLLGFAIITATVCIRLYISKEIKERLGVKLLWIHSFYHAEPEEDTTLRAQPSNKN